jgi:hypothetical protein
MATTNRTEQMFPKACEGCLTADTAKLKGWPEARFLRRRFWITSHQFFVSVSGLSKRTAA